jgi:hypothetical protein
MTLHFGNDFDGQVFVPGAVTRHGALWLGPRKLLQWLEGACLLQGYPANTDYLRIELYRQALADLLAEGGDVPFYAASFEADRLATAVALLAWRDELLLAGWDFQATEAAPPRLRQIAEVERFFAVKMQAPENKVQAAGFADRFAQVLEALQTLRLPFEKVLLHEPEHLQQPVIQRLMAIFREQGIPVETLRPSVQAPEGSALARLQRHLLGLPAEAVPDEAPLPSLFVLRARRDSDAAVLLAQLLCENPDIRPLFLLPEMNLLLEQNLLQEGFPSLGTPSNSLARPALQVLKLAQAFLWEPVDVFKVMEFVTLPLKPLDYGLALEIARMLAQKPGLLSDNWYAAVFGYLERAEVPESARKQYNFWFDRRRYRADATAPKRDAIGLYAYLQEWAIEHHEESGGNNSSLLVLAEQARRIREMLEALPEQRIGFLELERIVRTVYEPSPVQLNPAEQGRFDYVQQPGAIAAPTDSVVWWNCLFESATPPPDKWQEAERQHLRQRQVSLADPAQQGELLRYQHMRPVLQARRQLLLLVPEQADGVEAVPNLLLGDIEAAVAEHQACHYQLDRAEDRQRLAAHWALRPAEPLPLRPILRPHAQLRIERPELLSLPEYETPTNLENLLYYPHRWFFPQQLQLRPGSLLSITGDNTLLGNLAHRFFEELLPREDLFSLERADIQNFIDTEAETLLEREGATLLLYGREPERLAFLNKVKNAAWNLVSLLRSNGWQVHATEMELNGAFCGRPVRGKADLVLRRDAEMAIVDLKWSGANRRKTLIMNGEDLQLVLYAQLLPPPDQWPHTAYFILEEGKMIARNTAAFREAIVAGRGEDQSAACALIYEKMQKTYTWRMEQLRKGLLELRTARSAVELEALYEGQLFELLEMKQEDGRYDPYRILLKI